MKVALPPDYDNCILGETVIYPESKIAYSISGLLTLHDGNREEVTELIRGVFKDHGADSPVFIDDEEGEQQPQAVAPAPEPVKERERPLILNPFGKPKKIITPNGHG